MFDSFEDDDDDVDGSSLHNCTSFEKVFRKMRKIRTTKKETKEIPFSFPFSRSEMRYVNLTLVAFFGVMTSGINYRTPWKKAKAKFGKKKETHV